jgi:hypothetical protein
MAKRYRATDIWKKPFVKGLPAAYKLLWFYLLDDCDHAGIWQVDFEVAELRIGERLDAQEAIKLFGDRIKVINCGSKWFITDFIEFQYGELKENNKVHKSVIDILKKNNVGPCKGQPSVLVDAKDKDKEKDKDKDMVKDKEKEIAPDFEEYQQWTESILTGNDWLFNDKVRNMNIPIGENIQEFATSHLALLAKYPKMKPTDQNRFRISLIGHIQEKLKEGFKPDLTKSKKRYNTSDL